MGLNRWLDASEGFMSEVNYVLGRSYLESNENNSKSREYFQTQMQSNRMLKTRGYIILEIKKL